MGKNCEILTRKEKYGDGRRCVGLGTDFVDFGSWRFEPSDIGDHERSDVLPAVSRAVELRSAEAGGELDSVSAAALLHDRVRAADVTWVAAVPCPDGARTDAADVGCEEHDVRGGSAPWALPDGVCHVPRPHEHQGGGRADAQRAKQKLLLLRGVDPQQRQIQRLRHPSQGPQNVRHLRRQLHRHPGSPRYPPMNQPSITPVSFQNVTSIPPSNL